MIILYYCGPNNFHNISDNRGSTNTINDYRSIGNFWHYVNDYIANLLGINLNSPEFSNKAAVPLFKDLISKYTEKCPNSSLIIHVNSYDYLNPALKISDLEAYSKGNNIRFILTSKTSEASSISDNYRYTCPAVSNQEVYTFANEYLYQRFSKKLQYQVLFERLISSDFIDISDVVFVLHYLNHYTNHDDLYERIEGFAKANNIEEFYSHLIKSMSKDIDGFRDFILFISIANCIRLEVLTTLIPSFKLYSFYGVKEVLKSYIVCDSSDTLMLTNEKLKNFVVASLGDELKNYSSRYYGCIRDSTNRNDIVESLYILSNINNKQRILEYLFSNCKALSLLLDKYFTQLQSLLTDNNITVSDLINIIRPIDDYDEILTYHHLSTIFSNLKDYANSYHLCKKGYDHCKKHKNNVPYCIYALHLIQCSYMSKSPNDSEIEYESIIREIQTISSTWTTSSDLKMKRKTLEMAKQWKKLFWSKGNL